MEVLLASCSSASSASSSTHPHSPASALGRLQLSRMGHLPGFVQGVLGRVWSLDAQSFRLGICRVLPLTGDWGTTSLP